MGFVDYEVNGQVGVITINRPKALNALNSEVLDDLNAVFDDVDQNEVRCLVLTGAGDKSFVAGADIGEMSTLTKEEGEDPILTSQNSPLFAYPNYQLNYENIYGSGKNARRAA